MWRVPIQLRRATAPRGRGDGRRGSFAMVRGLPAAYMAEYSVVGLRVDDLEGAIEALERSGFVVTRDAEESSLADVDIQSPERLPEVVAMLERTGIFCEVADLIECVYQG